MGQNAKSRLYSKIDEKLSTRNNPFKTHYARVIRNVIQQNKSLMPPLPPSYRSRAPRPLAAPKSHK